MTAHHSELSGAGSTAGRAAASTAVVGLGSNLGDRWANLRAGLAGLARRGAPPRALSSVWETEPVGCPAGSPWFLNMVAELDTFLQPLELLDAALAVEEEVGRVRGAPGDPRVLDLDILLFGALVLDHPRLSLPHPRMRERRFVLAPLAEIAPGARDPVTGLTVAELLARLGGAQRVRRAGTIATARGASV